MREPPFGPFVDATHDIDDDHAFEVDVFGEDAGHALAIPHDGRLQDIAHALRLPHPDVQFAVQQHFLEEIGEMDDARRGRLGEHACTGGAAIVDDPPVRTMALPRRIIRQLKQRRVEYAGHRHRGLGRRQFDRRHVDTPTP